MATDFISREAAIDMCDDDGDIIRIRNIPAADVRPVVRGKWKHKPGHDGEWLCGVCNHDLEFIDGRTMGMPNFCPNCGADMREKAE